MHILLIHQAFAALDEPGGTRHHELARFLVACGHRVTIIASRVSYLTGASSKSSAPSESQNLTILRAYTYQALHKSFIHRVFAFLSFMVSSFLHGLRVRHVDLVWGTSPPIFQGVTAWLLARLKRVPFLFEVRDLWPDFAIAVGVLKNRTLIRMSYWLERFLYRRADRVLVNSPGFVDHVRGRGGAGVTVIPNGADPSMFDPAADGKSFRRAHGFGERFAVLYAGAHGLSNDLDVVLDAAVQLRERRDIVFVFVGDGKDKPALQARAAELGLLNVIWIPPVPKSGMAEALAAPDACLAILKPLEWYKTTYPNKVFDYMAAGRPVVLAIDGVIREVVEQAGCGVFARPGDPVALAQAVTALADDRAGSRRMGLAGRKYVEENFDRERLAAELAALMVEMKA